MSDNGTPPPSLTRPEVLFLSVFGLGFFPKAPGTFCSLAMLPILYALSALNVPWFFLLPMLVISTAIACFVAEYAQKKYAQHDPSWIVVDEALGMLIAWPFLEAQAPHWHLLLLFIFFRFFDIVKFWPASYFDQRVQHGAGTILDDIVSGIMAGLAYRLVVLCA